MDFIFDVFVDSVGNIVYSDYHPNPTIKANFDISCLKNIRPIPGVAILIDTPISVLSKHDLGNLETVTFNQVQNDNQEQYYTTAITEEPIKVPISGKYIDSLESAIAWCQSAKSLGYINRCILIGDVNTFTRALASDKLTHIYLKTVKGIIGKEKFPINAINSQSYTVSKIGEMITFDLRNHDEIMYHALIKKLLIAPTKPNRTGINTRGLFHEVLKFKLRDNRGNILPLLTTKRMPWKTILHELIWFLRGSTNTDYLVENKVTIWNDNSSRKYLDDHGLNHYREGELGPIYGHQWRHYNKEYVCTSMLPEGGYHPDQIANVIHTLKTNPFDRRMVVCAWNPLQASQMALVPCHYSFQFVVDPDIDGKPKYLNCLVNMRSADVFLGVPFNIASYAFLTHIISHITGLTPGIVSISMADCHLYTNHIIQAEILISRMPKSFPTINFGPKILDILNPTIDDFAYKFTPEDYIIDVYNPYPGIKAQMAV